MKKFALIGAAGYIAPRHLKAIRDTGNVLVAAVDKSDSVGVIDNYFPDSAFFTEFERFDRHVEKLRRQGPDSAVDYVSICSPNYLHDAHVRFALRAQAHAICEKPLVLNPWNIDALCEIEAETGRSVYTVLQLRLHPAIVELRRQAAAAPPGANHDIDLAYITSRGRWYAYSWKGDPQKSGGVATNIGVHFFDMLLWIFGDMLSCEVHLSSPTTMAGFLQLERAKVRWFLSVDKECLPQSVAADGQTTFRSITVAGRQLEFSDGFKDLHTAVYEDILSGGGFSLDDVRPSIRLVHLLRQAVAAPPFKADHLHPFVSAAIAARTTSQ